MGAVPFDPATQNKTGPVFAVAVDYSTTETYTVTSMSAAELAAKTDAEDRAALSNKAIDSALGIIALIDVLLAKGLILDTDLDNDAWAAYEASKPIADRVNMK